MEQDQKNETGEDLIDEQGRNATQQRMDAEGVEDVPIAVEDADQRAAREAREAQPQIPAPPPEPPRAQSTGPLARLRGLFGR